MMSKYEMFMGLFEEYRAKSRNAMRCREMLCKRLDMMQYNSPVYKATANKIDRLLEDAERYDKISYSYVEKALAS